MSVPLTAAGADFADGFIRTIRVIRGQGRFVFSRFQWAARLRQAAPKGRYLIAQGNALGLWDDKTGALKGRHFPGGGAPSGLGNFPDAIPRALPWAIALRPCGASNPLPHTHWNQRGIRFVRLLVVATALLPPLSRAAEAFDPDRLEKEVLVSGLSDTVQLQVAANGDVYFIERKGALKVFTAADRTTRTLGTVPVIFTSEGGLCGLALDRDFARTQWVYLFFEPAEPRETFRLSRFTLVGGNLDLPSEKKLLEYAIQLGTPHMGGGMQIDDAGNLWLGIGDNTHARITPATDEQPGREASNAFRSSANTQDLRGKILRIRPAPDGGYTIPAGNLFKDAKDGRPEIYIMGCRNPYRLFYDARDRAIYWAEVGSNTEERFGTGGFEEINRATTPGNSGWPFVIGPNTPYLRFDHATQKLGAPYSADRLINESRLNTGLRELPPARPALIWYPSEDSKEFPELGNGGRAGMVGFRYRHDQALASAIKLPAEFDGRLFIYDWCRSWIKTVAFDPAHGVKEIRPFLQKALLHRPIDLKLGSDGAIYMLEFGDKWTGNTDGVLSRIVYRRGNRAPSAAIAASMLAGPAPLEVAFSAAASRDADGDALSYRWKFGEGEAAAEGRDVTWRYSTRGVFPAELTVTDSHGATHTAAVKIAVGNAAPQVRIARPARGDFFDWGETYPFEIAVDDAEDGGTAAGKIAEASVRVRWEYREQPNSGKPAEISLDGGGGLIRKSTCVSCHALATASVGPSFMQVSERYAAAADAATPLIQKVLKGGAGNWGEMAMPPHPQHSGTDVATMIDYVLGLARRNAGHRLTGTRGDVATPAKPETNAQGGSYVFTASYTDKGAPGVPALTGEASVVLHSRRKRAALFDESSDVTVMEVSTLVRRRRVCAQLGAGSHLAFHEMNLAGIARIQCDVAASEGQGGMIEFRLDRPDGPLIGKVEVPVTGQWDNWKTIAAPIRAPEGVHTLFVVAASSAGWERKRFNLDLLTFERAKSAGEK